MEYCGVSGTSGCGTCVSDMCVSVYQLSSVSMCVLVCCDAILRCALRFSYSGVKRCANFRSTE